MDQLRSIYARAAAGTCDAATEDRRRAGRVKESARLLCDRGRVIDLSLGGMRLASSRRLRGRMALLVWDGRRGVRLVGTVVWTKRLGFRRWVAGIAFGDLDASTRSDLAKLAADNRVDAENLIAA